MKVLSTTYQQRHACVLEGAFHTSKDSSKMALSIRARNFVAAGSLSVFCVAVYTYTFRQMSRVRLLLCGQFVCLWRTEDANVIIGSFLWWTFAFLRLRTISTTWTTAWSRSTCTRAASAPRPRASIKICGFSPSFLSHDVNKIPHNERLLLFFLAFYSPCMHLRFSNSSPLMASSTAAELDAAPVPER